MPITLLTKIKYAIDVITQMKAGMLPNPQTYLKELPDPRLESEYQLHKLEDIFMIVMNMEEIVKK
jgi:hypothetical protein